MLSTVYPGNLIKTNVYTNTIKYNRLDKNTIIYLICFKLYK